MSDAHAFETRLRWPADPAQAKPPEALFSRNNVLSATGKPEVAGSAPAVFSGDASRYNPEELLLMSLSECHMLTYLTIAAKKQITVLNYEDRATGTLGLGALSANSDGGTSGIKYGPPGKMSMQEVVLKPRVTVAKGTDLAAAMAMHEKAHANCFMANSVNFPVKYEAEIVEA